MSDEKKLVFYCSASKNIDPKYNQAAREATRAACSLGYTILSGGTVKGTMGDVSDEVVKCGGRHIGIIPHFFEQYLYPQLDEVVWTDTMDQRKQLLKEKADVAVALPGGIGTLDELISTLADAKVGRFHGKIFALNLDGFYEPFKVLLDHYVATGMMDAATRELVKFPETVDELAALLA